MGKTYTRHSCKPWAREACGPLCAVRAVPCTRPHRSTARQPHHNSSHCQHQDHVLPASIHALFIANQLSNCAHPGSPPPSSSGDSPACVCARHRVHNETTSLLLDYPQAHAAHLLGGGSLALEVELHERSEHHEEHLGLRLDNVLPQLPKGRCQHRGERGVRRGTKAEHDISDPRRAANWGGRQS